MKKATALFVSAFLFQSCARTENVEVKTNCPDSATSCQKKVPPYGFLNDEEKIDGIKYRLSKGNILLSLIFIETVVVPAWLCGWYLWEAAPAQN